MLNETFLFNDLSNLPKMKLGWRFLVVQSNIQSVQNCIMPLLPYLQKKSQVFVFGITAKLKFFHPILASALSKLAEFGFRGLNLTIPHKVDVLPLHILD